MFAVGWAVGWLVGWLTFARCPFGWSAGLAGRPVAGCPVAAVARWQVDCSAGLAGLLVARLAAYLAGWLFALLARWPNKDIVGRLAGCLLEGARGWWLRGWAGGLAGCWLAGPPRQCAAMHYPVEAWPSGSRVAPLFAIVGLSLLGFSI